MQHDMVIRLAGSVQRLAERVHYASAVFAVERVLLAKMEKDNEKRLKEMSEKIEKAVKSGDFTLASDLIREKETLINELNKKVPHIRIVYADMNAKSARHIKSNGIVSIVLPHALQHKVQDSLDISLDKWTDDMRYAKNELRRLTSHELGHILIESLTGEKSTEIEADIFSSELTKLRKQRNNSLYQNGNT